MTNATKTLTKADLVAAEAGSFYTIIGAGGDLRGWVTGIEELLAEQGIGKPTAWFKTTGKDVNAYAGDDVAPKDRFKARLPILMFPLDGLDVGKLAIFKLRMEDRWFDDVVQNMRRV